MLADRVIKEDGFEKLEAIAGADVSFTMDDDAVAAAVVLDLNTLEILEQKTRKVELPLPYIPGFLGFREADAVVSVINMLKKEFNVLMVNGHGIMHPRGFGLASHVGLLLDLPTFGIAKRLIVGRNIPQVTDLPTPVKFMNQTVGASIKGNYVSIGHKISLKTAIDLTIKTGIFKTPEPVRLAHILATNKAKSELNGN
jgi:deoxyribonuclease V